MRVVRAPGIYSSLTSSSWVIPGGVGMLSYSMGEGLLSCSDITSALQVEGVDTDPVIDDTGDKVVAGSSVNDDSGVTVL